MGRIGRCNNTKRLQIKLLSAHQPPACMHACIFHSPEDEQMLGVIRGLTGKVNANWHPKCSCSCTAGDANLAMVARQGSI